MHRAVGAFHMPMPPKHTAMMHVIVRFAGQSLLHREPARHARAINPAHGIEGRFGHPAKMVAREQVVADLHINAAIGGSEGDAIGQQRNAGQSRGQTEESQQAFHGVLEC